MPIDPVCNMTVEEKTAVAKSEYKSKTYYFCAVGCKKSFDKNSGKVPEPAGCEKRNEDVGSY